MASSDIFNVGYLSGRSFLSLELMKCSLYTLVDQELEGFILWIHCFKSAGLLIGKW